MSDRRVLAVSAACITAAIFLFLLGTFPSWKAAIGDGLSWRGEAPPAVDTRPVLPAGKTGNARPQPSSEQPATLMAETPAATLPASTREAVPQPSSKVPQVAATMPQLGGGASPSASTASSPAAEGAPSFDIVRVEPSGDSVIAARSKAGATVTLLDQGHPIARATADGNGQVAFVPPALAPGDHSLMLSLGEPDAPGSLSSQSVAVSVPSQAKAAPMVALLQPDQPTRLLSSPAPAGVGGASTAVPPVSVGAIDVEEMGSVFATGHAAPGSQCRIYLNGSFVANVAAGKDGTWSLKIEHGMKPGHYSVRVDQLASTAGEVQARAEVPFDYPARGASSVSLLRPRKGTAALPIAPQTSTNPVQSATRPADAFSGPMTGTVEQPPGRVPSDGVTMASASLAEPTTPTTAAPGVPAVVAQLLTTKVAHGDSLWRISRKMLGHGRRYTQIYAANTSQIRNPRLIYPGQIFVMPQVAP